MKRLRVKALVIGILLPVTSFLLPLQVTAQERRPCIRNIPADVSKTRGMLGYPSQDWDPERIYPQAVVLITFADYEFTMPDPAAYYQRVLNEPGYNEGNGVGCAADTTAISQEGASTSSSKSMVPLRSASALKMVRITMVMMR